MFEEAGIPVNIRQGAFGTLLPMLRAGQAQIALELEPNVSQAVSEGARVVFSFAKIYGDFAITGLTATPKFLTQKPQLATQTTCALQSALESIHKQPEQTAALLSKRFPEIRPDVARLALNRVIADRIVPKSLVITPEAWKKAIDLRISVGDLQNGNGTTQYIDNRFADMAFANCH